LTGVPVRVGNFSVIGPEHLRALTVMPDLWNHYAASVLRYRIPSDQVTTERGRRFEGESRVSYGNMVIHGLSAISVFSEAVGVRLSAALLIILGGLTTLLLAVVGITLAGGVAVPDWATYTTGLLVLLVVQVLTVALGLTLLILFNRNSLSFLPCRDYKYFIAEAERITGATG
jgi:hypothetical protein